MCVLSVWLFVCACVYTCLYVCGYVCLYVRLWGDHGQSCLELAKVCLINATATGTEILKNLILPGMQAMSDLLTSFLLPPDPVTLFCHVYILCTCCFRILSREYLWLSGSCLSMLLKKLLSWVHWTFLHEFIWHGAYRSWKVMESGLGHGKISHIVAAFWTCVHQNPSDGWTHWGSV